MRQAQGRPPKSLQVVTTPRAFPGLNFEMPVDCRAAEASFSRPLREVQCSDSVSIEN